MDDDTGLLHDTIINDLRDVLAPVLKYSAYSEDFLDFTTFSILALLWNKNPHTENLHHSHMGFPYRLREADTVTMKAFTDQQHEVEQQAWADINTLIVTYSPQEFTRALIDRREHSPIAPRLAEYWQEAEDTYGSNPHGYTITVNVDGQPVVQPC